MIRLRRSAHCRRDLRFNWDIKLTSELEQIAAAALARLPTRPALFFEGKWTTWGELKRVSDGLTQLLSAGNAPSGGPVVLISSNRPWSIAALLSLISRGHTVQMVYGFQSAAALARNLEPLSPGTVVGDKADFTQALMKVLEQRGDAAIAYDGLESSLLKDFTASQMGSKPSDDEAPQIRILTSGTTGRPKQFGVSYDLISRHHLKESQLPFLSEEEAMLRAPILLYFPLANISGLYAMFPPLLKGQRAILIDRFSLEAWHQYVLEYRPTASGIPPSFYQSLLERHYPREDLASLQVMGAGAAPLDPALQREFEDRYGIPVLVSYGATEFGGPVTAMTLSDHARVGRSKLGTVGPPIAGAKLRVVDPETGTILPADTEGLLEVVSPRIGAHWLRTADYAMLDADGFLFLRGRADGAIMRGGFKVLPETVEAALKQHSRVADAVVVGVPDRRLGEVPAAAIIRRAGGWLVNEVELDEHVRRHVLKTHVPAHWLFCEDFPRTLSAKIDRQGIRKLFRHGH